jgi:hypothetical protein
MAFDTKAATEAGHSIDDQISHLAKLHNYDSKAAEEAGFSKEAQLEYLAGLDMPAQTAGPSLIEKAADYVGIGDEMLAPAIGTTIGAVTGPAIGPAIGATVDALVNKAAGKVAPPGAAKPTGVPQGVINWYEQESGNPYAGGKTKEAAYEKGQRAAGEPLQSRGSKIKIRKGNLGINNQIETPEPTLAQKAAANIVNAEKVNSPSFTRRMLGTSVAGGELGNAIEELKQGNYGRAALSGLGVLGGAASQSSIKPVRAIGTGLSAIVPSIQMMLPESEDKSNINKKTGGSIKGYAKGKLVEEGGAKIMDILKNKMAPLYAKAEGVPPPLPRATPKTDAELMAFAERMAPQVRGDFVRAPGKTTSVAGKTRAQFEREKDLQHDIRDVFPLKQVSNYSDANNQGKVKIGVAGDQTLTGKDVYSIAGNPLTEPSRQYGGALYPAAHPQGWASEKGAAQAMQNLADEVAEQYGGADVLGQYMKMGPEANNYAMHNADAIIKSINPNQIKQLEKLNSMIRERFPDFAGIENQAAILEQSRKNPDLRKYLDYLVQTKEHTKNFNLPSGQDIRHALSEPDLRNLEIGATGKSIMQMKPGAKITPSSELTTTTYSHDIPGDYIGGTKYPRSYELEFPDSYAALQNKIATVQDMAKQVVAENPKLDPQAALEYGKKYGHQGFGGFRMAQPRQIMDQQYMDETGKYEDYMKQLLGFNEGGPVQHFDNGGSPKAKIAKYSISQIPEIARALEEYLKGNISKAQHMEAVRKYLPIRMWNKLPPYHTEDEVINALTSQQRPKALVPVPKGMQTGNRLDIKAYEKDPSVYVDTVHDEKGRPFSYNRTGHSKDVEFSSKPNTFYKVGLGTKPQALTPMGVERGMSKTPQAMIKGTNVGTADEEVRRMMAEMLRDPAYTQVGMDPRVGSQFYDKSTDRPIWTSGEKLQSGPLVIVPKKDIETTNWNDPRLLLEDFPGKTYANGGKIGLMKEAVEAFKKKFTPGYYHGSPSNKIKEFDPTKSNKPEEYITPGVTFLTKNPSFAHDYMPMRGSASQMVGQPDQYATGATMYPVSANLGKQFDFDTPEGKALAKSFLKNTLIPKQGEKDAARWLAGMQDELNTWKSLEHPDFLQHLKDTGHNSFAVREAGINNVGIFEPKNIRGKFAKYNPEDAESADFMKAEGGPVGYAPGGKVGALTELMQLIKNQGGTAAAKRLEKAADMVPNLETKFQPQGLKSAFTADNASAVMLMPPGNFEKYAMPISKEATEYKGYRLGDVYAGNHEQLPKGELDDYLKYLDSVKQSGGFRDVPFLNVGQLPGRSFPNIQGHEGRHRMRALEKAGEEYGLVRMIPTPNLREPFPRRSQEEYLEALKEKIGPRPFVMPEQTEEGISRGLIELPEMFAEGGAVGYAPGGLIKGALSLFKNKVDNATSNYHPSVQKGLAEGRIDPADAQWMSDYANTPGNSQVETGTGAFKDQSERMQNFLGRIKSGEVKTPSGWEK